MPFLTRDAILAATDLPSETVDVPEWGGSVLVRGLTGAQRDQFEASVLVGKGRNRDVNLRNLRAKLVALSIVGEDGTALFAEADLEALGQKSAVAIERVFDAARKLSGMTAGDVEELTKNSESGQSAASTSA